MWKCEVRYYFRNYAISTKFDAVRIGRVDKLRDFSLVFIRARGNYFEKIEKGVK